MILDMNDDMELAKCVRAILSEAIADWLEGHRSEIISAFTHAAMLRDREQKQTRAQEKPNEPIYFTPSELAERWGFHKESIRRMIRQGRLPTARASRRLLIPVEEIKKYEHETFTPANGS